MLVTIDVDETDLRELSGLSIRQGTSTNKQFGRAIKAYLDQRAKELDNTKVVQSGARKIQRRRRKYQVCIYSLLLD